MIKVIGITASISLAIGSIAGYTLQKLEANQGSSNDAIAATVKSKIVDLRPPKSKRSELLTKYGLFNMLKDFHPAQITYVIESRRIAKYGNIATFALGISACVVCILPIKGYGLHLNNSFAPPRREVAIADIAQPVKFADVKQALSKPHCMLLGSTGDGKSTLAKHLAANCTAYTIVIDPHAAPDDWGNLPVFGGSQVFRDCQNNGSNLRTFASSL